MGTTIRITGLTLVCELPRHIDTSNREPEDIATLTLIHLNELLQHLANQPQITTEEVDAEDVELFDENGEEL